MSERAPLVSVVTATRNRPAMLRRALESIRAQTFDDYEMVVADDGSEPRWQEDYGAIEREFAPNLVFFRAREAGAPRSGPGAARNRAMERAGGKFIAFLDDDDQWVDPRHLEIAIAALETAGADYFFANMRQLRGSSVLIDDCFPASPQLTSGTLVSDTTDVHEVSLGAFVATMQHHLVHPNIAVVRRSVADAAGGFHEKVRFAEDYAFSMCVADRARKILYRPACVAHLRLPEADSSSLWESELAHTLDWVTVAQAVRSSATSPQIERCARAREAWSMRELSGMLLRAGRVRPSVSFAWQALCVYPTVGSAISLVRTITAATARSRR
jgi:glycosyltransferase involved in cell wall biosynthesis